MSTKYPGGIISKTAPTPSGPYSTDTAPGVWTLEQQAYWQKLGQWPTAGYFPNYIEDVFSTYLYTATGPSSGQTITNGIDLSTKGGMVWIKNRTTVGTNFATIDTVRGATKEVYTDTNGAQSTVSNGLTAFTSSGFTLGIDTVGGNVNYAYTSPTAMVSWTFREQAKFFDVVTYTGDGAAGQAINHNLGSVPGFMVVKRTNTTGDWAVYHRSLGATQICFLNDTQAAGTTVQAWNNTEPTSTQFTVGVGYNASGSTYVAYLFAHNAGGFGLTGSDNVISCGSYTGNGSATGPVITLGYEPQWVMIKKTSDIGNWHMHDIMRDMSVTSNALLWANLSDAEVAGASAKIAPLATGFQITNSTNGENASGGTYIYIAIRRGPMKVPTSGTSVFNPVLADTSPPAYKSSNFNTGVDSGIEFYKPGYPGYPRWASRLTGTGVLPTSGTAAESAISENVWAYMNGYYNYTGLGTDSGSWMFKRAPSFFDEVCYTGNGTAGRTITHNLTVTPELIITKERSLGSYWYVYSQATGPTQYLRLEATNAAFTYSGVWNDTAPTSSVFTVGSDGYINASGQTYVAYLFATCPGVSKVGSYTGTGTTLQVDCGFTGGSRFVMIKRTDSTGDWYVWDSARGIVAGNDPYLLLNSTAAEVTSTDYVDTYSAGFEISSTAPSAINASGGTFIFLAIA